MSIDDAYRESVADEPRERPGEVTEAPGKVWFRHLDEAVIEPDRCVQCASCVAACPSDSIGIDEETGHPTLVRMCTGCSSCWDYCPRSGLRYERVGELARTERGLDEPETVTARAVDHDTHAAGQDGGAVTALLAELLDAGDIDGAVVTREDPDRPLRAEPVLATTPGELAASAGSYYNQPLSLGYLDDLVADADIEDPRLALVGTPCVIEGASALERYDHDAASNIELTIALFCTRTFEHERLAVALAAHGVDPADVSKLDVTDGTLSAVDETGAVVLEAPVSEFDSARLRGCDECADFLGAAADISAGSVGNETGDTTLVIRTDRGKRAFESARDAVETADVSSPDAIDALSAWNERRAKAALAREYDPAGPVGISHADHRDAYDDTDRAPRPLNPARVHQYEEWC